jgi:pyruvate dehydrogenase E2 component (dihydrolipoamide acetyltransferase)
MAEVTMPRLSDSMEEGTIVAWLKAEGDQVARGEPLAEIETDKANMVFEADDAGLLTILVPAGETVAIGVPIATLGDGHEPPESAGRSPAQAPEPEPAPATGSGAEPAGALPGGVAARISASPVARRAASKLGVPLESVTGTGPYGRIFKSDVMDAAQRAPTPAAPTGEAVPSTASAKGEVEVIEPSRAQAVVARRMAESKATAPHFSVARDVDMTDALALRAELKRQEVGAPSLNDFVVRACALALRAHPKVNGAYVDGSFELYGRINIGIAVATPDNLVVPVVADADALSLAALAAETRRLVERTRSGAVTPPELAGGTFTVSNLGTHGVDSFTGVVNPPQAAILCAGAARARPAVGADGELTVRELATLTLVADHRILYGADAAAFLGAVADLLQRPLALLA